MIKVPDKCPACGGNFLLDFIGPDGRETVTQECRLKPDHRIAFHSDNGVVKRLVITINVEKMLKLHFYPHLETIIISRGPIKPGTISEEDTSIPYFEPDFSDYKKLINKLKTYVWMT